MKTLSSITQLKKSQKVECVHLEVAFFSVGKMSHPSSRMEKVTWMNEDDQLSRTFLTNSQCQLFILGHVEYKIR